MTTKSKSGTKTKLAGKTQKDTPKKLPPKEEHTEDNPRRGDDQYRSIIESIVDAYFETDLKGKFTFINDVVCQHTGYSREELMPMSNLDLQTKEDAKKTYEAFVQVYKTGEQIKSLEHRIRRKDGSLGIYELSISLITNSDSKPIGFRGLSRDITERKRMEDAIRQSEEKYRTIIETIQDGYVEMDLAGNIVFMNSMISEHLGYSREELIGKKARTFLDEVIFKKMNQIFAEIHETGKPVNALDLECIRKDKTKGIYELSVSLARDAQGKPIGFRNISRDITERKKMEDAVRRSEERYRNIIETITDGYIETALDGHYTFVNDVVCGHLKYSREELIGIHYSKLLAPASVKPVFQAFAYVYKTGIPLKSMEMEGLRKDKTTGFYDLSVSLARDAQGKPIGFRSISRDVTERKKMEEALRQSEERYRTILEEMSDGYFECDLAGTYNFANNAMCETVGYSKKEFLGMNYRQFADKGNARRAFEAFNKIYRTGKAGNVFDYEIIRKDGAKKHVEISASLKRDSSGAPMAFKGILRDITERKLAEEALRQNEEKYRTMIETLHDGYFETDIAGKLNFLNDMISKHLGYSREELIGKDSRLFQDEANYKKTVQFYTETYKTGKPIDALEMECIRKDGTKGTYELSLSLIRDAQGKPIGFRGISRDITERRIMEDDLRQSEEKYRTIIEGIEDGYAELDLKGKITFFNKALPDILGYPEDELIHLDIQNRQYVDEETAKFLQDKYTNTYSTGKAESDFQYEIISKDGTKRSLDGSITLMRDAAGKPVGFRGLVRDRTDRRRMEDALRQSEEKYRTILEETNDGYYEVDLTGNYIFMNEVNSHLLGYEKDELLGKSFSVTTFKKEDLKTLTNAFGRIYKTNQPVRNIVYEALHKDGTTGIGEIAGFPLHNQKGEIIGFRGIARDITERMQMEETIRKSEERYRSIIEQMEDGYFECDLRGNFTFVNDAEGRNLGYTREELLGMNRSQYTDEKNAQAIFNLFNEVYQTGKPIKSYDLELIKKDGAKAYNAISISLIKDAEGKTTGFRGIAHDISERKRQEERVQHLATHDGLTALPNRALFSQLLNHALEGAKRYNKQLAVFFIDLDRFKNINDSLGHEAGDQLLQEIATRFRKTLRAMDIVARIGGDEFVVLLEEISDLKQAAIVARKLLAATMKPVTIMSEECRVTASIGISIYPTDGNDDRNLLKNADTAMYSAKKEGKNNFQFYSKDNQPQALEKLSIEKQIRFALERNEFSLAYQAKLDFKTGVINGVEALLRWNSPELGEVSPLQFIPVAEESGLIIPLGRWVIQTACQQSVAWQKEGLPPVCVAVNLSLRQLLDENLVENLKKALTNSGLEPGLLEMEVTESMVMHNTKRIIAILARIKELGVRLAIEDFGTGYLSLTQIQHYPVDTLKVDRSFIRNIMQDSEGKATTEAIIAMGKTLSLTVIAEGVETQEQMDYLREQACDEMQGYYFSKPISPEKFSELLRAHDPSSAKTP